MEIYFLILLFILMMAALGSGFPVAFALPGSAILTIGLATVCGWLFFDNINIFFAQDGPSQWLSAGVINFRSIYYEFERDTLIAIPLFIFMGIMLEKSKIAEDLLVTMAQLFGPVPGGLGISVVFVGALLAATTGIVGATVVAMGLISLPAMMRHKYSPSLASGTICASGTLGQIIPPSIVLIILADQLASASDQASATRQALYRNATGEFSMPSALDVTSTSAGNMFLGAFLPGLVLVGVYIIYILISAILKPSTAPAVPNKIGFTREFFIKVGFSLIPPLVLIFLVLGSIVMGIATVNQAGAIGAIGATVMAGYRLCQGKKGAFYPATISILSVITIFIIQSYYDLNVKNIAITKNYLPVTFAAIATFFLIVGISWSAWRAFKLENTLNDVMIETAKTTSMVFIILIGATMLTASFRAFGGEEYVKHFLGGLPGGFWSQFVVVMAVIFILGFFLDFIEIAVVVVPIVAPILLADPGANITAVWLGVMIGVNIQTSFLTPPFGFALFYLRGVATKAISTLAIYKGVVPFIILQLIGLVIVGSYPQLVNYLPNRMYLSSFNAPPPQNPKLQRCVEEHLETVFFDEKDTLLNEIEVAKSIDLSPIPKKVKSKIQEGINATSNTFANLEKIKQTKISLSEIEKEYALFHSDVRRIERDINRLEKSIKETKRDILSTDDQNLKNSFTKDIEEYEREKGLLLDRIPIEWESISKEYQLKIKELSKYQRKYRRDMDTAYLNIKETVTLINDKEKLKTTIPNLQKTKAKLLNFSKEEKIATIKTVEKSFKEISGTNKIKSYLSKSRRAFKKDNEEKGIENFEKSIKEAQSEVNWRKQAEILSLKGLSKFEMILRNNVGLRNQDRLPKEIVPKISSCKAVHNDISLSF